MLPQGEELDEMKVEPDSMLQHNDNAEQEEETEKGPDPDDTAEKELRDAAALERRHALTRNPIAIVAPTKTISHDSQL